MLACPGGLEATVVECSQYAAHIGAITDRAIVETEISDLHEFSLLAKIASVTLFYEPLSIDHFYIQTSKQLDSVETAEPGFLKFDEA